MTQGSNVAVDRPADTAAQTPTTVPITGLLSYRLSRVANALSRSAAVRYRKEFDVSIGEWRALALLGTGELFTLNRLARRSALDKAQMSRVVARLVDRGLVRRRSGSRRATELSLTPDGESLYRGLIGVANERNEALRSCLTQAERRVLDTALDKLADQALVFERDSAARTPERSG